MSTKATLIYLKEKALHIYQELLDDTVHVEIEKPGVLVDVEIMPFPEWVSLGFPEVRVTSSGLTKRAADGALPSVEEVICPICQSIVRLYKGNIIGVHSKNGNLNNPVCKMAGVKITPRR